MNKQAIKTYIINTLLERGYTIYTSITTDDFVISRHNVYGSCLILPTTTTSDGRIIVDLRCRTDKRKTFTHTSYTYIIAIEVKTKELWLIPVDDISQHSTITLSINKEHYIITSLKQDEVNLIAQVRLKEKTSKTAAKINEADFAKLSVQEQRDEVHEVLERS